jgi:anti-sigma-K factor RskA
MEMVVGMDTSVTDTRPTFARLTEGKAHRSWRSAVPAVVVVVALVALLAYLASSLSSASQKAMSAQRDADDAHQQMATMTKQVGTLQQDLTLARDPGRTTVMLAPVDASASTSKKKATAATPSPETAWAAVTWGEAAGGKTWMRVNAYGLAKLENGQAFHLWLTPASGNPVDVGTLDADQNGSAYLIAQNLPGLDQGKSVTLSQDDSGAKAPTKVLAKADLPKLQPSASAAAPAAPPAQNSQNALPQARSTDTTQQMHKAK